MSEEVEELVKALEEVATNEWWAEHEGYEFNFTGYDGEQEEWYIQINPNGRGYVYDGWWTNSKGKTLEEVAEHALGSII